MVSRLLIGLMAVVLGVALIGCVDDPPQPDTRDDAEPVSVLGPTAEPDIARAEDVDAVELGLMFAPTVPGELVGIRTYHAGHGSDEESFARLWSSSGTLMAEAALTDQPDQGWNVVDLTEPVPLAAGETYVVSYFAPSGGYPVTHSAFTSPTTGSWFQLPASAGVFTYGENGGFPTSSHQASNYFVDPLFQPSAALAPQPRDVSTSPHIVVDQFGYPSGGDKVAVIRDPRAGFDAGASFEPDDTYALVDAASGDEAFVDTPTAWNDGAVDESSGDVAWWFDFSSVTAPGTYYVLDRQNDVRSFEFSIGDDVYADVLRAAVRTFFYQRAGADKPARFAGDGWADGASHVGPSQDRNARRYDAPDDPATERDLSGGWYDAGDYNRYTSWASRDVITLLRAYAETPRAFTDDYDLPESGNGIPDIVDEARWGLDWLGRMQNDDGSVLSILGVTHASPPSAATGPSAYGPASTSATLSAAAAFAYGSTVLRSLETPELVTEADTLLARAERAWQWAERNPSVTFVNNDPAAGTEGLGAGQQETDDAGRAAKRLEAAAHLLEATGRPVFRDVVDKTYEAMPLMRDSRVSPFELESIDPLLTYATLPEASDDVAERIDRTFAEATTALLDATVSSGADPYRAPIPEYTWGSNKTKANQGIVLWRLASLDPSRPRADDAAAGAAGYLHYLHGTNPMNLAYLSNMSGLGAENSVNEIFHTWFGDGSPRWDRVGVSEVGPPPGFVTGGPNPSYSLDPCCAETCDGAPAAACSADSLSPPLNQPPQKSYKDFNTGWPQNSWTVTENSNGYQAAYIRLLATHVTLPLGDQAGARPSGGASSRVVSLDAPVHASSGNAASATDESYDTAWRPEGDGGWLAIDLASLPTDQRDQVVLTWSVDNDDGYFTTPRAGVCPAWDGRPFLRDYRIEASAGPGGGDPPSNGWDVVESVSGNALLTRQHVVDLEGSTWIRLVGDGPNGIALNVDVTEAHGDGTEGWLFLGDSITARYAGHASVGGGTGGPVPSFTEAVDLLTGGQARPISVNAGASCAKASDATQWIDDVLEGFPGRYVALGFGTNDGWEGAGDPDQFYRDMESLVDAVVAAGDVPVVPTIPWPNDTGAWEAGTQAMNEQILRLYRERAEVVPGPDLYQLTEDRPELFEAEGDVHPNEQGAAAIREAWVQVVGARIYGQ